MASAACAIQAGLEVIEVTFTLPSAARAIERLRHDHPAALIGAGTVRTVAELEDAAAAGAEFLVAPGLNSQLVEYHPIAISECARRAVEIARRMAVEVAA